MDTICHLCIKKIVIILFLLIGSFSVESYAQSYVSLEPKIGYGTFRMKELLEFQQTIIAGTGVNAQATDEFPAYLQYGLKMGYSRNGLGRVGLNVERGSTGGRIAYGDYTGSFTADQLVKYTALGLFVEDKVGLTNNVPLYLCMGAEISMLFNSMKLSSDLEVFNRNFNDENEFSSKGIAIQPYIGLSYPYKRLEGSLTAGYVYTHNWQFHVKGDKNLLLDEKIKVDWSGLRFGASLSFKF